MHKIISSVTLKLEKMLLTGGRAMVLAKSNECRSIRLLVDSRTHSNVNVQRDMAWNNLSGNLRLYLLNNYM